MANFLLDAATGDLSFTNGRMDLVYDDDAIRQDIKARLLMGRGDWFRDRNEGTDWFGAILGKHSDSVRRAEIRRRILEAPYVRSLPVLQLSYNGASREMTVEFVAALESGRTLEVRFEDLTPGGA